MPGRLTPRVVALLAVIAFHATLGLLLRGATWPARQTAPPARMKLTLRPLAPEPARARAAPHAIAIATPSIRSAPAAIRLPPPSSIGEPVAQAREASAESAQAPEPAASHPPRPLDLTLPRRLATPPASRHPALDDARANTARTTPEQRMSAALDTRVIEDDLGDGRIRVRRGADCVIVQTSRIGQLMPFNDAAARSPRLVGACP